MSEEIELVSKTTGEVAEVLVDKSGIMEPAHALARSFTTAIDAIFYPGLATLCMKAAAQIEAKGLSRRAIETMPPRLLRGILERGAMEHDPSMQEMWANLLTNAVTTDLVIVRAAFPTILGELEPVEARVLDRLAAQAERGDTTLWRFEHAKDRPLENLYLGGVLERGDYREVRFPNQLITRVADGDISLDNLLRLQLLQPLYREPHESHTLAMWESLCVGARFTQLGWEFVQACRPPRSAG